MQSIWAREELPFLKYGLIASDSAVTGQTDKACFANVAFSYFDLGKKKKYLASAARSCPSHRSLFFIIKKKKGEREQRYKKHLSSLKKKNNSLGAGSCKRPAAGERFGQTS